MKRILLLFLTILVNNILFSQNDSLGIEITTTDITLYPKLKSDKISVFDIRVGMTQDEVNQLLSNKSQLHYSVDEGQPSSHRTSDHRIFVWDKDENNEKKNCLLYLIWTDNTEKLTGITFFEDFAPYLVGATSKLFTFEDFDIKSNLLKDYLGYPNKTEVTLDDPVANKLKHTAYYYYPKGIAMILKENSKDKTSVFAFIQTK